MSMIMMMMMIMSIMFLMMKHPVSLMMIIFIQTILISLTCGLLSNSWWFSYMLFMAMIGGLLVLFMYMINVASNEKFNMKLKLLMWMLPMSFFIIYMQKYFKLLNQTSWWSNFFNINTEMLLMKYYNYPFNFILIMMMIYLLITMIMSVKITDMKMGALRQKF